MGETVEFATSACPDLWSALADPGQVENALLNLAINAWDAMPGGGKLTIECANAHLDEADLADNPEATVGDYVVLAVSDDGSGMAAVVKARAFEPFFTTNSPGPCKMRWAEAGLSLVRSPITRGSIRPAR